jgi:hypothetical protein
MVGPLPRQAGNHPDAAGYPEGIEPFPADWFDHPMKFLEVESMMHPQLLLVEGKKQLEHHPQGENSGHILNIKHPLFLLCHLVILDGYVTTRHTRAGGYPVFL